MASNPSIGKALTYDRGPSKYDEKGKVIPYASKGGRPPNFKSVDDFVEQFIEYLEVLQDEGYERVPSYSNFAKWKHRSASSVHRYVREHPEVKEYIKQPLSDVLSTGALMGKYRDAITIFTLKNMCDWTDKRESTNISADKRVADEEEAKAQVLKIADRLKEA